jgi:hypothetical protein
MRKLILIAIMSTSCALQVFCQGKVKVFNTTVKVKDIIGTTNLSPQKWSKDLPDVLVRNEDYYLKTIGSYRDEYESLESNSLFNLVDKGSYPLIDEINMRFYDEVAIPELKDSDIQNRSDFVSFCEEWDKLSGYKERKLLLFKNEFIQIGKEIQKKRFQFTYAPYTLKQTITKKFNANLTADIIANLKANNIDASGSLVSYLSNTVTSQTEYEGLMIIAEFDDNYMQRLKNSLNGLSRDRLGTDDFSIGLKEYGKEGSTRAATTGLVVFKLNGKINKSRLTEAGLKADLKAKFTSLPDAKIGDIAAAMSIGFVSKVERLFSADIENIYIKSFLTSKKVDDIALDSTIKTLLSKYDVGKDAGKNLGILAGSLDRYYINNNSYPAELSQLTGPNAIDAVLKLGTLMSYSRDESDSYTLTFAGEDGKLNTADDKIHKGNKGKTERSN